MTENSFADITRWSQRSKQIFFLENTFWLLWKSSLKKRKRGMDCIGGWNDAKVAAQRGQHGQWRKRAGQHSQKDSQLPYPGTKRFICQNVIIVIFTPCGLTSPWRTSPCLCLYKSCSGQEFRARFRVESAILTTNTFTIHSIGWILHVACFSFRRTKTSGAVGTRRETPYQTYKLTQPLNTYSYLTSATLFSVVNPLETVFNDY